MEHVTYALMITLVQSVTKNDQQTHRISPSLRIFQNDPELTRQHHAEIEETTQFLNKSLISNSTSKENDVVYNYTSDPTINHSKTKDQNSTSLHPYESFQETSFAKDIVIMILVLIVLLMMFKKSCIVKLKKICPLVSNESDQELLTPLDVIYTTPNNDSTKPDRPVYGAEGGLKINVNRNDKHPETYVVAEVPKHDEVEGFWQSLWNKNITNLVLVDIKQDKVLTNFWPRKNKIISYNNISIYCGVENIFKFYEYRTFTLTYNSETRLVNQLRFSSWSDRFKPFVFVPFFQEMSKMSQFPILVHSTIDMGTGFVMLCDTSNRTDENVQKVDQHLKKFSTEFKVSSEQYQLAQLVVFEYQLAADIRDRSTTKDKTELLILSELDFCRYKKYLKDTNSLDRFTTEIESESSADTNEESTLVDILQGPSKVLIAQQPSSNALTHLWSLVHQADVKIVLFLNETSDRTYWLSKENPKMTVSEDLMLEHGHKLSLNFDDWMQVQLLIHNPTQKKIEIYSVNWTSKCLPNVETFVQLFVNTNDKIQTKSVLVTCSDGKTMSGLYVAMSYFVEKIKANEDFNFCASVRTIRRQYQRFLQDEEQWVFLWKALQVYMDQYL
jgi:hypothetical protein